MRKKPLIVIVKKPVNKYVSGNCCSLVNAEEVKHFLLKYFKKHGEPQKSDEEVDE